MDFLFPPTAALRGNASSFKPLSFPHIFAVQIQEADYEPLHTHFDGLSSEDTLGRLALFLECMRWLRYRGGVETTMVLQTVWETLDDAQRNAPPKSYTLWCYTEDEVPNERIGELLLQMRAPMGLKFLRKRIPLQMNEDTWDRYLLKLFEMDSLIIGDEPVARIITEDLFDESRDPDPKFFPQLRAHKELLRCFSPRDSGVLNQGDILAPDGTLAFSDFAVTLPFEKHGGREFGMILRTHFQRALLVYGLLFAVPRGAKTASEMIRGLYPNTRARVERRPTREVVIIEPMRDRINVWVEATWEEFTRNVGRETAMRYKAAFYEYTKLLYTAFCTDPLYAHLSRAQEKTYLRLAKGMSEPLPTNPIYYKNLSKTDEFVLTFSRLLIRAYSLIGNDVTIAWIAFHTGLDAHRLQRKNRSSSNRLAQALLLVTERGGVGKSHLVAILQDLLDNFQWVSYWTGAALHTEDIRDGTCFVTDDMQDRSRSTSEGQARVAAAEKEARSRSHITLQTMFFSPVDNTRIARTVEISTRCSYVSAGNHRASPDDGTARREGGVPFGGTVERGQRVSSRKLTAIGETMRSDQGTLKFLSEFARGQSAIYMCTEEFISCTLPEYDVSESYTASIVKELFKNVSSVLPRDSRGDDWVRLDVVTRQMAINSAIYGLYVQRGAPLSGCPFEWWHLDLIVRQLHTQRRHLGVALGTLMPLMAFPTFDLCTTAIKLIREAHLLPTDQIFGDGINAETGWSEYYKIGFRLSLVDYNTQRGQHEQRNSIVHAIAIQMKKTISQAEKMEEDRKNRFTEFSQFTVKDISQALNEMLRKEVPTFHHFRPGGIRRVAGYCSQCKSWSILPFVYVVMLIFDGATNATLRGTVCCPICQEAVDKAQKEIEESTARADRARRLILANREQLPEVDDPEERTGIELAIRSAEGELESELASANRQIPKISHLSGGAPVKFSMNLRYDSLMFVPPATSHLCLLTQSGCNRQDCHCNGGVLCSKWEKALIEGTTIKYPCRRSGREIETSPMDYAPARDTYTMFSHCINGHTFKPPSETRARCPYCPEPLATQQAKSPPNLFVNTLIPHFLRFQRMEISTFGQAEQAREYFTEKNLLWRTLSGQVSLVPSSVSKYMHAFSEAKSRLCQSANIGTSNRGGWRFSHTSPAAVLVVPDVPRRQDGSCIANVTFGLHRNILTETSGYLKRALGKIFSAQHQCSSSEFIFVFNDLAENRMQELVDSEKIAHVTTAERHNLGFIKNRQQEVWEKAFEKVNPMRTGIDTDTSEALERAERLHWDRSPAENVDVVKTFRAIETGADESPEMEDIPPGDAALLALQWTPEALGEDFVRRHGLDLIPADEIPFKCAEIYNEYLREHMPNRLRRLTSELVDRIAPSSFKYLGIDVNIVKELACDTRATHWLQNEIMCTEPDRSSVAIRNWAQRPDGTHAWEAPEVQALLKKLGAIQPGDSMERAYMRAWGIDVVQRETLHWKLGRGVGLVYPDPPRRRRS